MDRQRPAPGWRGTLVLVVLGLACLAGLTWERLASPHRGDRAMAQDFLRGLRESNGCSGAYDNPERLPWRALAKADHHVVMELFRQLFRQFRQLRQEGLSVCPFDMDQLLGIALGVDHDGSRSRAVLAEFIVPALKSKYELPEFVRWMLRSPRLRVEPSMVPRIFELWLRRIEDEREIEIFHERSHPTALLSLERWAGELVANQAVREARGFFPRLLALLKNHRSAAAGTLASLAPLLTPDEAFTALATALQVHAGFGLYHEWCLGALVERSPPQRAGTLIPVVLGEIERASARNPRNEDVNRFLSWGQILSSLADKLDPAQRKQVAFDALRVLAKGGDEDRLSALALAILPVLGPLDREQVAPVLRPWLEQWPERLKDMLASWFVFSYVAEHAVAWLGKADPADLSRAAFRIRDLLLTDTPGTSDMAMEFGSWAPLLSPSNAFAIAEPLAEKVATASRAHVVVTRSITVEKLSQRLSSQHALAIARTIAPRWQTTCSPSESCDADDRRVRHWLGVCLRSLVRRMDDQDRLAFDAKGDLGVAEEKETSASEPEDPQERVDREFLRETTKGMIWPSARDDPSAYLQAWFGLWLGSSVPRSVLIHDLIRAISTEPRSLRLAAYPRPISVAQLYLDLLKDYRTDEEDWKHLIPALRKAARRPAEGSLWELLAWTEKDPAGRALGLDWTSRTPW